MTPAEVLRAAALLIDRGHCKGANAAEAVLEREAIREEGTS